MSDREHSKEITPPPPIQGICIPRTEDALRNPLRCDAGLDLSTSPMVKIYVFYKPELWWETSGPLTNGLYSLRSDHSLRNQIVWPSVQFTMYDAEQMRWVDVPTFARIEVRPDEFLMFRAKSSMSTDSDEFPAMDSLTSQLRTQYRVPAPENAANVPTINTEIPTELPITPARNLIPESAATTAPRRAKRRRSQACSSPVRVARDSTKRRRLGDTE
ncbi:hypothetical protein HYPSUDRAFT_202582 [Hypholoma sublateritium FD-334 SS-4]|uniref:Uncharacterized protein n=1 Tax=Hypholoma sublateritium (strain FD-334 SS-4) TaxID=945553 RepID=A0A0D2ME93_HYPSF|nr:hypothetical protein HYPSUDRAFT_208907 [Hypholoma sublateritium FD-334 SS-4]KJA21888.1 hypothetical protein HYPSUDRAFT_202582 [Hypholoma sublateritium FD-334 SS-4]